MKATDPMIGPFDREMRRFAEDYEALRRQYFSESEMYIDLTALEAKTQALCTIYGVTLLEYDRWQRASLRATQAARRRLDRWKN